MSMREMALHIMDIAENGIKAGADLIRILVDEARSENILKIEIADNGPGIPPEILDRITDPFVTTRTERKVGLGLSLLETSAKRCDGTFDIFSKPGDTRVTATFRYDHIDRTPMGDMAGSIALLFMANPKVEFVYAHIIDGRRFVADTREIKKDLKIETLADPSIMMYLGDHITELIEEIQNER